MADGKNEDNWTYEGKSTILRDILVRAGDATFVHFDILSEQIPLLLFFFSSLLCTGRTGPEEGIYFLLRR